MLTFLDPLAAVLLLARPRLGVMLTVVNITGKVVLNAWGRARAFLLDSFEPQNWHTPVHAVELAGLYKFQVRSQRFRIPF